MSTSRWLTISIMIFIVSCEKPLPTLEGINLAAWTEDRNGCKNIRKSMRSAIAEEKEKLLALDQMQIVRLLGKPDQNELATRNQKFFYYFLGPGPSCGTPGDSPGEKLVIRFNAIGLAKEVAIE